ncbi:MAG: DUF2284 domain-containing protein [Lachnospiraceae bacterium]|nr:DUF2284 domain-containing protein [Lachnospiraceae bacterium]
MTEQEIIQAAKDSGFSTAEHLDLSTLHFLPEVRSMCSADRCHSYNRNWACPPACGTLEEWQEKASHYSKGVLLQTIGDREDSYDIEAMIEVAHENKDHCDRMIEKLIGQKADFTFLAAGACTRCEKCTWPDAPCRFPEKTYPSMEAAGLFVSQVCKDNGVPYNYGDEKIAYTCCVLFNE